MCCPARSRASPYRPHRDSSCRVGGGVIAPATMKFSCRFLLTLLSLTCLHPCPLRAEEKPAPPAAKPAAAEAALEEPTTATAEEYLLANLGVIDNLGAAADVLDTVKDQKTAKIATAKLTKLTAELRGLLTELNELGTLPEDEQKKVDTDTKLTKRGSSAAEHFQTASNTLAKLEDAEVIQILKAPLQAYVALVQSEGKDETEEPDSDAPKAPATAAQAIRLSMSILDNMEQAAEVLEAITDTATAQKAIPTLTQVTAELKVIVKKAHSLGELSPADKKLLENDSKLSSRGQSVGARFEKAAQAMGNLADKDAAPTVAPALKAYGRVAQTISGK